MSSDTPRPVEGGVDARGQIHVSTDDGVGWIVLDNPAKHNAMSESMWRALVDALAAFDKNSAVRCVVITGQGDKAFCAGADIAEKDRPEHESMEDQDRVANALRQLQQFPKPTIAMVRGYCLGAGVALAIACDLRVAGIGSRFGIPAAKLGLAVFYSVIKRLADLVGPSNAKRIVFTADRFSAAEALRFNLIDELVASEELSATVKDIAGRIAANAPLTIVAAKHAVEMAFSEATDRASAEYAELERACMESQDYVEGRRAFMEKRTPVFRGR